MLTTADQLHLGREKGQALRLQIASILNAFFTMFSNSARMTSARYNCAGTLSSWCLGYPMARAYHSPRHVRLRPASRRPGEWQALRGELVALLDQVEDGMPSSR